MEGHNMATQYEFKAFLNIWADNPAQATEIAANQAAAYHNNPEGVRLSIDDGAPEILDED
jgi:hypothetical protein